MWENVSLEIKQNTVDLSQVTVLCDNWDNHVEQFYCCFFAVRTGVTSEIKDAITLVIENRPEDPISFLAEL